MPVQLVDRSHATTHANREELFAANLPHNKRQEVEPGTSLFNRLVVYLNKASSDGLAFVTSTYQGTENLEVPDTSSRTRELASKSAESAQSSSRSSFIGSTGEILTGTNKLG